MVSLWAPSRCISALSRNACLRRYSSATASSSNSPYRIISYGMESALDGIPPLEHGGPSPAMPGSMKASKLESNGLRICSLQFTDNPGSVSATASVALAVHAGTRFTNALSAGAPFVLSQLAFKGSAAVSRLKMIREYEASGFKPSSKIARESIMFQVTGIASQINDLKAAVHNMVESAVNPIFLRAFQDDGAEMDSIRAYLEQVSHLYTENRPGNDEMVLCDMLHASAYGDYLLGMPLFAEDRKIESAVAPELLVDFVRTWFSAPRLCLVGVNVEHAMLEEIAKASSLAQLDSNDAAGIEPEATQWMGGRRTLASDKGSLVGFGFNLGQDASLAAKPDVIAPYLVLEALFNGVQNTIQLHSRMRGESALTNAIIKANPELAGKVQVHAQLDRYSDASMFSVHAHSKDPLLCGKLQEKLALLLKSASSSLEIDADLARAKKMACQSQLESYGSPMALNTTAGHIVVSGAPFVPVKDIVEKVKAVSAADVKAALTKVIGSRDIAAATIGIAASPTLEETVALLA